MYHYNICTEADKNIFIKQCAALEKHIPNIVKKQLLNDIDGSETQIYELNGNEITVHNSFYVGAVYVDSDVELEQYFT
jgi:hypothetical protein